MNSMLKAIFYKEWIKTRWYFLLSMVFTLGFTSFQLLRIYRGVSVNEGAAYFWQLMIQESSTFIDALQYIPLGIGIVWALVQFAPEMHNKCLKLSLHLPCSQLKITFDMLICGFVLLLVCFASNLLLIYFFFKYYFAHELVIYTIYTLAPWFISGLAAYLLFAWICLEPTWKRRIFNLVIAILLLRIFFISDVPAAYTPFIGVLCIATLLLFNLPWLSIVRFKEGKQD